MTWSSASLQLLEASTFIDLFVDGEGREVQITVGASSLQRKTSSAVSSYSSPSLSNYTRTTGVKIYLLSIQRRTTVFIIIFDRSDN